MDYLTDALADFQDRLEDISKVDGINHDLIKIFKSNLDTIYKDITQTGQFGGLLKKVERYQQTLETVERLPEISANFETLREQSVVLIVSAFEVFLGDIFRLIANNNPEYYVWPDKDKKISIDIDSCTANFTLGDAIISHLSNKQYSFQDLSSAVKAINDYLGIKIEIGNDIGNPIVFGTACRHVVVHRNSIIDKQFLNQTKDIEHGLKENDRLKLTDEDLGIIKKGMLDFSEYIVQTLAQRDKVDIIES